MKHNALNIYSASDIVEALLAMANERYAQEMQRFFKTGAGEYAEGDRFVGIRNPQVRHAVKNVWRQTSLAEAVRLVKSPIHEVRLCGLLIMVEMYLNALKQAGSDFKACREIFDTYISLHEHINNWDLVDLSAIKIVGNHEAMMLSASMSDPSVILMDQWIKPGHTLWQQRISMVSTWMLIHKGMPELAFNRAAYLLNSSHDLLHKAAGWMLREAWKYGYKDLLREFLTVNVGLMPSVMLSYACEQMSADERHHWQRLRKS